MALALSSGLDTDQGLMLAEQLVDNPYMAPRLPPRRAPHALRRYDGPAGQVRGQPGGDLS